MTTSFAISNQKEQAVYPYIAVRSLQAKSGLQGPWFFGACLSAPGYMQFVVVHVEAEIDIAALFPERTVHGTVNREHG